MRRALATAAPIAWATAIFYASSLPTVPLPAVANADKVAHAGAYAVLALLAVRALMANGVALRTAVWVGAILAAAYGVSDEVHQSFVPGRSPEALDVLADAVGAGGAAGLWYAVFREPPS